MGIQAVVSTSWTYLVRQCICGTRPACKYSIWDFDGWSYIRRWLGHPLGWLLGRIAPRFKSRQSVLTGAFSFAWICLRFRRACVFSQSSLRRLEQQILCSFSRMYVWLYVVRFFFGALKSLKVPVEFTENPCYNGAEGCWDAVPMPYRRNFLQFTQPYRMMVWAIAIWEWTDNRQNRGHLFSINSSVRTGLGSEFTQDPTDSSYIFRHNLARRFPALELCVLIVLAVHRILLLQSLSPAKKSLSLLRPPHSATPWCNVLETQSALTQHPFHSLLGWSIHSLNMLETGDSTVVKIQLLPFDRFRVNLIVPWPWLFIWIVFRTIAGTGKPSRRLLIERFCNDLARVKRFISDRVEN